MRQADKPVVIVHSRAVLRSGWKTEPKIRTKLSNGKKVRMSFKAWRKELGL